MRGSIPRWPANHMSDKKKHLTTIPGWDGTLEELTRHIANLRYDALANFLFLLQQEFDDDSFADEQRGRKKLAKSLLELSYYCYEAGSSAEDAWIICKPHMKDELDNEEKK